jgi:RecB family endonuclease NucS
MRQETIDKWIEITRTPAQKPAQTVLITPELSQAETFIKEALTRNETIIIVGACIVNYFGRASSILPRGERIIILKPDGTVLVHQKEKREPVNWNPPGSKITVKLENNILQITSVRKNPKEILLINIDTIIFAGRFSLYDPEDIYLLGSESQIVQEFTENPHLIEEGFKPLTRELKTEYGMIDLYGVDKHGNFVIIEFKRRKAGLEAVSQLKRYVDEIRKEKGEKVRGILAAPDITENALKLLRESNLEFLKISKKIQKQTTTLENNL